MKILTDQHTHSNISEDSQATLDSMCRSAIDKGIDIISFTEHVDFNPRDPGYHFFNEQKYSNEIIKMRQKYSDRIQIMKGVEFDAPNLYSREFKQINSGDYDIILGSVHMIDNKFVGDSSLLEKMTLEELFKRYYEQLLDLVRFGGFDVVAHFDFPKRYYMKNILSERIAEEILNTMIEKGIALEINTSPLRRGYHESSPGKDILGKYATLGGTMITIGSDAHIPENIGADFDYAFKLIQSINDLTLGYFKKRVFKAV
ncbi:MAG: histidinol-phosphatase HisJ family protein [Spirochaetaceae bacterium]|nr:histidinol-phosphatase HisJ family protein [Spirochaetaceae bacterium]